MDRDRLQQYQLVASIVSAIAVPVVLGVVGFQVQQSIAEQGIRKDYADMALRVLSGADKDQSADLRVWAVSVLDKYAPIPFSDRVREQLLGGALLLQAPVPDVFMTAPRPWIEPPESGFATNDEANKNYTENMIRAKENALQLEHLQKLLRAYQVIQRDLGPTIEGIAPDSIGGQNDVSAQPNDGAR